MFNFHGVAVKIKVLPSRARHGSYIYLVYGMYWQLNISTSKGGKPECVLIRALELPKKEPENLASGPGKLCRYLKLDKSFYGEDLSKSKRIWLENSAAEKKKSNPLKL